MGNLFQHMSYLNIGRLISALIDPDRRLTPAEKRLAEHAMYEGNISEEPPRPLKD